MAPPAGALWPHFHQSDTKPNGTHYRATHWRCIDAKRPKNEPIDVEASADVTLIRNAEWFAEALASAMEAREDVNGEKKAMAGHLRKCPHSTTAEKAAAATVNPTKAEQKAAESQAAKRARESDASDADDEARETGVVKKKRKRVKAVETSFKQSTLEVFRGLDIPFNVSQTAAIHAQFLRATQSANLPEMWTSDPEVLKLFMMFRSRAGDVIPSRTQLGGSLLRDASNRIDAQILEEVSGADVLMSTDGWRSKAKDAVGGVSLSHKFKTLLIDIIRTNAWSKDGESMALRFGEMIDKSEEKWGCIVVGFLTDNDGGSKKGRKRLGIARAWLLLFPCCSHQGQLILAEYLRDNSRASEIIEELIEAVNWLNSKDKVRDIFDQTQREMNGKILAYLLPNLTRWTTHLVAALRFNGLKGPIRHTILNKRDDIIKAHIGAESNRRKREEMRLVALDHCTTLEGNGWWDELEKIINDLEHICYLTNIAQSDHVRPDQFFLALAGLYLHFGRFSARVNAEERAIGKKMCARIDKRFKELDQAVFVLALVLNPFQKLSRFGDNANIDPFILSTELITLYKRVKSRPPSIPRTPPQQQQHEQEQTQALQKLSSAFMQYLAGSGPFKSWENPQIRATYIEINSNYPIPFWEMFRTNALVVELANFSLMLLRLVVNQAGLERSFSDFANKKNKKRNRLGLVKMGQQAKVGFKLRRNNHKGLVEKRDGRKNHDDDKVKSLLAVPRYAEALLSDTDDSDEEGAERVSVVVRSRAAWRRQMVKWQEELREAEEEEEEEEEKSGESGEDKAPIAPRTRRVRPWLPISLSNLFSGTPERAIGRPVRRPKVVSEEALYMELLAAEHSDEGPDAGALEGSGDDYEA
ncbi:ribonuclease H-like domain-containing protein [Mycena pura]|uniref:Ribonuclease H-like domain-containing protein n=1 Tax=Mycena pura TaxID=153505 RepID=A0AAD7E4P6_9AGAR|nr:ribonuclease H-like domain-containing protein [Mycena pura]